MKSLLSDPVFMLLVASVVWPIVGAVITYLFRGLAKSENETVRRLFAGFSATTFDAPKFGRAVSQRPPMPSIVDIEPPAPPTPRGPLGIARVAAMALGSVLGVVSMALLSSAAHVAGCAWLQRAEPKVVHVVHAIDGICDAGVEVILPSEARPVCMAADVADGLADRYEAAKEAGATQEIRVETESGEPVAVVPPAEVATVVEQTPARKKRRKRGPRHVDGGMP